MAYEEVQLQFLSKVYVLLKNSNYEKYNKYGDSKVTFKDVATAKKVGLFNVSQDNRKVYKDLVNDINALNKKEENTKEINYLAEINKLLFDRRRFLINECGGEEMEDFLMEAPEEVIKLSKVYMELYRAFISVVESFRVLDKIKVKKLPLSPEFLKIINRYKPEDIFRKSYEY